MGGQTSWKSSRSADVLVSQCNYCVRWVIDNFRPINYVLLLLLFALQFPLPCIVLKFHIKPFASDISILLHFCRFIDQVLFAPYLSWLYFLFVYLEKPTECFSSFASDVAMSSKFRQAITAFQWKLIQERFNFLLWDWSTFYNMYFILSMKYGYYYFKNP